jgi:muramidase (phage lysozyme)
MALPLVPLLLKGAAAGAKGAATAGIKGASAAGIKGAATAGIKGASAAGIKGAATAGAKGAIKSTVKKTALNAVKNKFGKKKVSKDKLLGKPEGALVKVNSDFMQNKGPSSIVKSGGSSLSKMLKSEEKSSETGTKAVLSFDFIIKELQSIQESLINIKSSIESEISTINNRIETNRKNLFKQKAEDKESRLEKKSDEEDEKESEGEQKKSPSLFDRMWRFLSNVLVGSLLNWALNYLPLVKNAFESVIEAFKNPLKRLKFSIISLTTNFPRFLRKVLSLSKKIFSGPAKFIGGLLKKASKSVKNVFTKAGKFIFNLIKNPLRNIAQRILGETGKNVTKTTLKKTGQFIGSNAPKILKRLATFSKVFKRVPIIGALIGIGIDLALGEPLDRAIVGAIGASLGAAIGGAIGTGVIPIPLVGTAVGGVVGGAIGDWAGKKFYEHLKGKLSEAEKESENDTVSIQSQSKGGSVKSHNKEVTRETAVKKYDKEVTRQTAVQKRKFVERKIQKIPSYEKSSQIEKKIIDDSKKNIFKGEKSAKRFVRISDAFRSIPLIGEVMNLGIAIGMGKKISQSDSRKSADQIANSIGVSIRDNKIKGIDPEMAESISSSLSQWARREILYQLSSKNNLFSLRKEDIDVSESRIGAGADGGGGMRGGGGSSSTYGTPEERAMLDAIAFAEGTDNPNGYRTFFTGKILEGPYPKDHPNIVHHSSGYSSAAFGRYQFMPPTWNENKNRAGATDMSPINQDKVGILLSRRRGVTSEMLKKEGMSRNVMAKLAPEWASFPTLAGGSYYGQPSKKPENILSRYQRSLSGGSSTALTGETGSTIVRSISPSSGGRIAEERGQTNSPTSRGHDGGPHQGPTSRGHGGKSRGGGTQKKQIVFHWTAADSYTNPVGEYHSVFTGDGKKHQKKSYNQRTAGTLYRPNAINLSIAAMNGAGTSMWPKSAQLHAMAQEAANLAKSWGWSTGDINARNVPGHGEVGSGKDGRLSENISTGRPPSKGPAGSKDNYGPTIWGGDGSRWDLSRLRPSQRIGDGEKEFRNLIKSKMSGSSGIVNDEPSNGDTELTIEGSQNVSETSAPLDSSKFFDIVGDPSNKRNQGFIKPNGKGRSGGGDLINPSGGAKDFGGNLINPSGGGEYSRFMSSRVNNTDTNTNNTSTKINSNPNRSITKVSNFNVTPLYANASYESTNPTIIMMQLPQQINNQPQLQMPSNTRIVPLSNSKSTDVYKKVLTKALY